MYPTKSVPIFVKCQIVRYVNEAENVHESSPDSHSCSPMVTTNSLSGNELSQVVISWNSAGYLSLSVDKCAEIAAGTRLTPWYRCVMVAGYLTSSFGYLVTNYLCWSSQRLTTRSIVLALPKRAPKRVHPETNLRSHFQLSVVVGQVTLGIAAGATSVLSSVVTRNKCHTSGKWLAAASSTKRPGRVQAALARF
jgi:hypothetical protein